MAKGSLHQSHRYDRFDIYFQSLSIKFINNNFNESLTTKQLCGYNIVTTYVFNTLFIVKKKHFTAQIIIN